MGVGAGANEVQVAIAGMLVARADNSALAGDCYIVLSRIGMRPFFQADTFISYYVVKYVPEFVFK